MRCLRQRDTRFLGQLASSGQALSSNTPYLSECGMEVQNVTNLHNDDLEPTTQPFQALLFYLLF